jgi:DNA processing protein
MTILNLGDEGYPAALRQIHDPPARLFVQGRVPAEEMIAIVGSRRATPYGLRIAYRLAADLSHCGVVVVSGLARGVDAAAHRGALSGPTPTVAVMATGLDRIYPPEHADLAAQIARTGALMTEAPDGTPPLPSRFPVRNRIICGLSKGVVVVEAAARSGALITANMAAREGREVFAVPGSIENPLTEGTHALIDDGAKLVRDVDDILEEFPTLARVHARARMCAPARADRYAHARADSGPRETALRDVWELLDLDIPRHHDEVAMQLGITAAELNRRITVLEMGNYIIGDAGGLRRRGPTS